MTCNILTVPKSSVTISAHLTIGLWLMHMHVNLFPNKPLFLRVYCASPLKTLWEKEKLLVTSNFSFSHSVFYTIGELSAIFTKLEIVVCNPFNLEASKICRLGKD